MGIFGFGKKPEPVDRYIGKPFLKLVDSFVLKCIGELDLSQETMLVKMTPKLQEVYLSGGTWEDIVVAQLHFPPNIGEAIQSMWVKNKNIAKQNGVTLTPMQFVEMFVTNNVEAS